MRLTTDMKKAFVKRVMLDTPNRGAELDQRIRDEVVKAAVETLPKEVAAIWNNETIRGYICNYYANIPAPGAVPNIGVTVPGGSYAGIEKLRSQDWFKALIRDYAEGWLTWMEIDTKLSATIANVTTLKALKALLPELDKYMPVETETSKNPPAVANLISDMVKAGWPKDGKPPVTATEKVKIKEVQS